MQPKTHRKSAFDNETRHLSESLGNLRNMFSSVIKTLQTGSVALDFFDKFAWPAGISCLPAFRGYPDYRINLTRSINLDRVLV